MTSLFLRVPTLKIVEKQSKIEKNNFSIHWFTSHLIATARTGPGWSRQARATWTQTSIHVGWALQTAAQPVAPQCQNFFLLLFSQCQNWSRHRTKRWIISKAGGKYRHSHTQHMYLYSLTEYNFLVDQSWPGMTSRSKFLTQLILMLKWRKKTYFFLTILSLQLLYNFNC